CTVQRHRRCFTAPGPGRPRNNMAAPDVRAPVVRGRWHFGAFFGRFTPPAASLCPVALASPAPGDIRWRMNEAIRPGQGTSSQAAIMPELSVVVPTFNERDNVTALFRKLETALADIAWEVIYVDDN